MPQTWLSTRPQGLDHRLPAMRLWHKAKRLGVWDPREIDLTVDAQDWRRLNDEERDVILRLTSLFQGGEESVTMDLLPLMMVMAQEGRLEEEMYLTSFLWEEAKHVEAFRRFLDEVADEHTDLSRYHTPSFQRLLGEELPEAMGRLRTDSSPAAQAAASVTYNMIVEGVLAETGYHAYDMLLQRNGIMPGMQRVIGNLRRDESRHIAYGVFLLSRLVAEHGDPVWETIEQRLNELLPLALGVVAEVFEPYPVPPFGLRMEDFADFALSQFGKRVARLEKARTQTLEQVMGTALETEETAL
ncbi:MAG TPA: R2-like ligand-binding oxidase [Longimicrobium sp.]|jgi:ribonucleoside-diphosphate reductase beta chain|uniref:R2-like ligand-binding oxidase n=1 Tax=Longimicrobium sp. TaxID=2029185 RepID=UPI002EDAB5B8